jgi:hypothetical protein
MSEPSFETRVNPRVQSAAKAVAATITTVGGVAALFITSIADGSIGTAEWGTLLTGALTAGATIVSVWRTENKAKR